MTGGEIEYIRDAKQRNMLAGDGWFTKQCHRWLESHVGAEKALLTHSCTAALEMAALLVDIQPGDEVIMPSYIRLWLERAWLRGCRLNASQYIVQTPSMQRLAAQQLGVPVSCAPFVPAGVLGQVGGPTGQQFDFLYVASGEAHKNHAALIEAWGVLAEDGVFPSLALTLAPEAAPALCARVAQVAARGLRIHNVGVLPHDRLLAMYRASGALIYPSSFESFGLPLIEARQAGLPVLAPELDYVRDVTDPDETFDPRSPISIARAVRRHLEGRMQAPEPRGAEALLGHVLAREVT